MHFDGHESVICATQFRALSTVKAYCVDASPGFVDKAGNRISLDCNFRHPPGMDHVICRNQKSDFGVHRNHQRLVDLQQVVLALLLSVVNLFLRSREVRKK